MSTTEPSPLEQRYELEAGSIYLTGIQAVVRGLIDQRRADAAAGLRTAGFVSGYPGSPVAGFDREVARQRRRLDALDVLHVPGVNEELAATAIAGTQLANALPDERPRYDGVLGVWYGKAPGVDRAADAIRHANFMGVGSGGGVVAVAGDDPGAKSSSVPSASEALLASLMVPTLAPGSVQEALDLTRHAFQLSRASGLWTALKLVADVADGVGTASVAPGRIDATLPILEVDGRPYRHTASGELLTPWSIGLERNLHDIRLELARRYGELHRLNRVVVEPARPRLGLVASGTAYHELRDALALLGLRDDEQVADAGLRILKVGMLFPLASASLRSFAEGLPEIVVVEEKLPFLETALRDHLYGMPSPPRVVGTRDEHGASLIPSDGELTAARIATALGPRLAERLDRPELAQRISPLQVIQARRVPKAPARTPFYCSGCPHNRSTQTDADTLVGVGTGCHAMVFMMDRDVVGGKLALTQMGGEGALWIGLSPFVEREHMVQNIGDGTFFHSGQLAIRAAVAADVRITFKLLYNRTVAMTGGQDAVGGHGVPEVARMLVAEGVRRVVVTAEDPERYRGVALPEGVEVRPRERFAETERELRAVEGVTVLIHDQHCAAEKRRLRKRGKLPTPDRRIVINERVCEGCGDCGRRSNCISLRPVETEFGRKTQVHASSCNFDESCLEGDCPSFVVVKPGRLAAAAEPPVAPAVEAPVLRVDADAFTARLVGIGGTGVVTVAQVLGMAASFDGFDVHGLDQTGMAQKGGPVVSDVRLSRGGGDGVGKAPDGSADLLLAFDVLGAAVRKNLLAVDPGRTVVVVSTSAVPTGKMAVDVEAPELAPGSIVAELEAAGHELVALDAEDVAQRVFGDSAPANVLALGAAYQAGALPISSAAIERAIEVNGTAVAANLAAFAWGRAAVARPESVPGAPVPDASAAIGAAGADRAAAAAVKLLDRTAASGELRRLLEIRVAELVRYQSAGYAARYLEAVEAVAEQERERTSGGTAVTEAFAHALHKLMAYKDEYEVARLHLDKAFRAQLVREWGEGARASLQLHPPLLRALGMRRKLSLGRWFDPALVGLRAARRLRGTPLDPFGHAAVRKLERELPGEYRDAVLDACAHLSDRTRPQVVALAELPDMVRGYEELKVANVERYRAALASMLEVLTAAARA